MRSGVLKQPVSCHYDIYVPEGPPRPLLVCLHGYGQTKETALRFGKNIRRDWPIAALQAPHAHHLRHTLSSNESSSVGFSWVSTFNPTEDIANHHNFVRHVIEEAFEGGLTDRPQAFLFGFSQSVSLNYRFAAAHPEVVRGVVAVAGATPSPWQLDGQAADVRLEPPVLHIAPRDDEVYPSDRVQVFRAVLEESAADLTWLEPPGRHRVPSACYPVIREWLKLKSDRAK